MQNEKLIEQSSKIDDKFNKIIEHLQSELTAMRAGRANPVVLSRVTVDYYGTQTPLNQMANISVTDARTLTVSLYDASAVKEAKKAIIAADLGLNPVDDGKVIRLAFPQLTEERRKDLIKQAKKVGEDSKVALRNERRDALEVGKKLKKEVSEDEIAEYEKLIQKKLDAATERVDKMIKDKEADLLEI
ncbi:MAG: ribosome recycling factor [Clostridia bacterium]|jgi:ribosome recycling factor|nr:ribosome recycling factor [Clostridia bacterium]